MSAAFDEKFQPYYFIILGLNTVSQDYMQPFRFVSRLMLNRQSVAGADFQTALSMII